MGGRAAAATDGAMCPMMMDGGTCPMMDGGECPMMKDGGCCGMAMPDGGMMPMRPR